MGQQLVQGGRGAGLGIVGLRGAIAQAAHIVEGGDEFGHRRIEVEQPAFRQHHQGDAGDRLGHRIDARDGVPSERQACVHVTHSGLVVIGFLPVFGDQHRAAGKAAPVHIALHPCRDAVQTRWIKTSHLPTP